MSRLSEKYSVFLTNDRTWRFQGNGDDMCIQKFIEGVWIDKGMFGGGVTAIQPPEGSNDPSIFAPDMVALYFSDPTTEQNVIGCSVDDEDSAILIMDVTVTNGILNMPMIAPFVEIGNGLRFTASILQLNNELAGLQFTPTNLTSPTRPQDGTIEILLNDQDGTTPNASHTITVEVLKQGRE